MAPSPGKVPERSAEEERMRNRESPASKATGTTSGRIREEWDEPEIMAGREMIAGIWRGISEEENEF